MPASHPLLPRGIVHACYVFAHGRGAGMNHAFMAAIAEGLAERYIAMLRSNPPFMEQGSKRFAGRGAWRFWLRGPKHPDACQRYPCLPAASLSAGAGRGTATRRSGYGAGGIALR